MKNVSFKNLMVVAAIAILATIATSCAKENDEYSKKISGTPKLLTVQDGTVKMRVDKSDGTTQYLKVEDYTPRLWVDGDIFVLGTEGFKLKSKMPQSIEAAEQIVEVQLNHGKISRLHVDFSYEVMGGDGKKYTIYPDRDMMVNGEFSVVKKENSPFHEEAVVNYTADFSGLAVAACSQNLLVTEVPTEERLVHDTVHINSSDTVVVYDTRIVVVYDTVLGEVRYDTVSRVVVDTLTVYVPVHDTITVIEHDTVTVHDTTVTPAPTPARRYLYSDSADSHLSVNANAEMLPGILRWSCENTRNYVDHFDADPYTESRPVPYRIYFPYIYTVTGTAYTSQIGTSVIIMANVAHFGELQVELIPQARQCAMANPLPCSMTLTSATLTSNGVVVEGSLEGVAVTATIPVTINDDPSPVVPTVDLDFPGTVLGAWVTTSHRSDLATSGEDWMHVLVENNGVYTWYYALYTSGLSVGSFMTQSTDATTANKVVAAVADGLRPALVYDHRAGNQGQYVLGLVEWNSRENKIIYYDFDLRKLNELNFVNSTESGYNFTSPYKEILTNGRIEYNGVSYTIQ